MTAVIEAAGWITATYWIAAFAVVAWRRAK